MSTEDDLSRPQINAPGPRSIAAQHIGNAFTGDVLPAEALHAPGRVVAAPGTSNLPPPALCLGREDELAALRHILTSRHEGAITQSGTVHGLGGIGKSTLAVHYAHHNRADYTLIWWINAASPDEIETSLTSLTHTLVPDWASTAERGAQVAWAMQWLAWHPGWLLVYDNVENPDDLTPYTGALHQGHHLATSRRATGWPDTAPTLALGNLDPDDATTLLCQLVFKEAIPTPREQADARSLVVELGYFPLAIKQAGAYLAQNRGISLDSYRRQLDTKLAKAAHGTDAERTLARIWNVTLHTPESAGSPTDYPGGATETSSERVGKDSSAKKEHFAVLIMLGAAVIAIVTVAALLVANGGAGGKAKGSRVKGKSTSIEYTDSRQALVEVVAVTPRLADANSWTYKQALTLSSKALSGIGDPGGFGNSLSRYDKWFLDHDAVPVGGRADQIVLEGNSRTPVRIIDIEVNKECRPPLAGSIFDNPTAGIDTSTVLSVDLDRPMQIEESGPQAEPGPYFDRHTISLKRGEQHVLVLETGTSKFYCEYTLSLNISRNGEVLTQVIKNNGVPFRVSAWAGDYNDRNPYKRYARAYIAGIPSFYACPSSEGKLIRVDPLTYTNETKKCP